MTVSWNACSGATSYDVFRAASSGGEGAAPYETGFAGTSFVDSEVTNGTSYYYQVMAVNANGDGPLSNEVSATPSATGGSGSLAPVADAYVSSLNPTTNYGGSQEMDVRHFVNGGPDYRRIYLRFDLSKVTGTVSSAQLKLYGSHYQGTATQPDIAYGVSDTGWSEMGIDWNNMPALGTSLSTANVTYSQQYYAWDVTSYVQSQAASGATLISLAVDTSTDVTDQRYDIFHSKEAGSEPPQLAIAFGAQTTGTTLSASGQSGGVLLNWTTPGTGSVTYNIYRSTTSGAEGTTPFVVGLSGTTYTDTAVADGQTYYYQATVVSQGGESPKSNEASATPQYPALAAPTNLAAAAGNALVSLSRTAVSGASSYRVYRGTAPGGEQPAPIATGVATAAFSDSGVTNGVMYYYKVTAVSGGGESGPSNEASATPESPALETTAVSLTSSQNPANSGDAITLTATVRPAVPDGETVQFYDSSSLLGTGSTAASAATFQTSTLAPGSHSITASYSGDSAFAASASQAVIQVVNQSTSGGGNPFIVTNTGDSNVVGSGSLRAAINAANASPGATITFETGLSGTINLTGALPPITANVSIDGPGPAVIAIDGQGQMLPFEIDSGAVSISGLEIRGGDPCRIYNSAYLKLDNCVITDNLGSVYELYGGVYGGEVDLRNCVISYNMGFAIQAGGLTMSNCTVVGNDSGGNGCIFGEFISLSNCTVADNDGGISASVDPTGSDSPSTYTTALVNCTVTGNGQGVGGENVSLTKPQSRVSQ